MSGRHCCRLLRLRREARCGRGGLRGRGRCRDCRVLFSAESCVLSSELRNPFALSCCSGCGHASEGFFRRFLTGEGRCGRARRCSQARRSRYAGRHRGCSRLRGLLVRDGGARSGCRRCVLRIRGHGLHGRFVLHDAQKRSAQSVRAAQSSSESCCSDRAVFAEAVTAHQVTSRVVLKIRAARTFSHAVDKAAGDVTSTAPGVIHHLPQSGSL